MFDIGFWELVLCAVVALVVLGPERMPQAVRTGLLWWRTVRQALQQVRSSLEHEIQQMEQMVNPADSATRHTPPAAGVPSAMTPSSGIAPGIAPGVAPGIAPDVTAPVSAAATGTDAAPAHVPAAVSDAIAALKAASPVDDAACCTVDAPLLTPDADVAETIAALKAASPVDDATSLADSATSPVNSAASLANSAARADKPVPPASGSPS